MSDASKAAAAGQGQQDYPMYFALWPLQIMGILDETAAPTGAWPKQAPRKRTRVAIIDTPVGAKHPNLTDAIDKARAFDLFSTRLGAFPYYPLESGRGRTKGEDAEDAADDEEESDLEALKAAKLANLQLNANTQVAKDTRYAGGLLQELIDRLAEGKPAILQGVRPVTHPAFSAHGTAVAGLVGGRPATVPIAGENRSGPVLTALPFAGVDPFCEIVPISTSFDPDPEQLILALLYAELIAADVVLLPRDFPDPMRTVPLLQESFDAAPDQPGGTLWEAVYPVELSQREKELWDDLYKLTKEISLKRPIICAAGNNGDQNVIYPACLQEMDNGIISVGAVNSVGECAGYSNYGNMITVMAPSNDKTRFDRDEIRIDEQDPEFESGLSAYKAKRNGKFSYLDVISTGVPGRHGYNRSEFWRAYLKQGDKRYPEPVVRDFSSFYCRFGGTSAAAALVAGFVSLGVTRGGKDGPGVGGVAAKKWLLGKCTELRENTRIPSWTGRPVFPRPEVPSPRTSSPPA
jgi:subtilisin family serine protease